MGEMHGPSRRPSRSGAVQNDSESEDEHAKVVCDFPNHGTKYRQPEARAQGSVMPVKNS